LKTIESIQARILSKDLEVWAQPLKAVEYGGEIYLLDGHNRLKAFTELARKGSEIASKSKVSVQMLTVEEAAVDYKEAMEYIKQGAFKTTLKANN
jgi:hypothetical protein